MRHFQQKRIFISSTVKNFRYLRQEIALYIEQCGHIAYANELSDFPVTGSLQPMDECLNIITTQATHFILLLGERWGLPYYKDTTRSITEQEFFTASGKHLPMICFIEGETWKDAQLYHRNCDALGLTTDSRVLQFIEKHLLHGQVKWVVPFSHIKEILLRLRYSWLVSETRDQRLLFVKEQGPEYFSCIDDYSSAFHSFLTSSGPLPLPQMELPQKCKQFIDSNRSIGHSLERDDLIDPFDEWLTAFQDLRDRLNLALSISAEVFLMGRSHKQGDVFRDHYEDELKAVIRKALSNYLRYASMNFYGDLAYGKIPNYAQMETSVPCKVIEFSIHDDFRVTSDEILSLRFYIDYSAHSFSAYIPAATFEKWEKNLRKGDVSSYVEFLKDWATIVVSQAIAFTHEITSELTQALVFDFIWLLGVERGKRGHGEHLLTQEEIKGQIITSYT